MAPEICLAAARVHDADKYQAWADLGVTALAMIDAPGRELAKAVRAAHKAGLRAILFWPEWGRLGLCDEDHSFRAYDGRWNNDRVRDNGPKPDPRVKGPSVWHPGVRERLEENIASVVEMGADGVVGGSLGCDRAFPTDWYPFGSEAMKGCTMFWSFDKHAKAAWREYSGGAQMPRMAVCTEGVLAEGLADFYSWYLDSWRQRITDISLVAIEAGIPEAWTWYLPISHYSDETVANATAGNQLAMDRWRRDVEGAGGRPTIVTACMFGLKGHWDRWYESSVQTAREITKALDWNWIVGMEADFSAPTAASNIRSNGAVACDLGFSGMFVGAGHIEAPAVRADIADALETAGTWSWRESKVDMDNAVDP